MKQVFLALVFLFGIGACPLFANNESAQFAEKVNLAIRRTAHHLLIANGDSTSAIPPVQQPDANTFVVTVDQLFDYDKLPALLQQSLDLHHIKRAYNVSILDCKSGMIKLGYNFADVGGKKGVPCAGRNQRAGCYRIMVTFEAQKQVAETAAKWWILPIGTVLALLGLIVWKKSRTEEAAQNEVVSVDNDKLHFGESALDMSKLMLTTGNMEHSLTYREAKLLRLFATNLNQVLERDYILKSVWEDEGIIVGRSVDVFVSRLRKMLVTDARIKISAVHGVGYRMDILS